MLDALGIEAPATIKGHTQSHFDGVSMRYSFDDPTAPGERQTQFYSMLGSRGIWHDGWKAITTHPTISGWGNFNDDEWELYHVDVDRSELHNLAAEHPDKLRELVNLWYAEAGANEGFPLDDRSALEILTSPAAPCCRRPATATSTSREHAEVPESQAVDRARPVVRHRRAGRPPRAGRAGRALRARGRGSAATASTSRTTGCTTSTASSGMFEQKVVATEDLPTGENLILSASFEKDGDGPAAGGAPASCRSTTATPRSARAGSRPSRAAT